MQRRLVAVCIAVLVVPGFAAFAHGQAGPLKKLLATEAPTKTSKPETPDEERSRLELWLREARDTLARLDASGYAATLPEGISKEELDGHRSNLEQIIPTITRALKNASAVSEARKTHEAARAAETAWEGFKEKPPYSLLFVDELVNERAAVKAKLSSHEAALSNFKSLLETAVDEAKTSEESLNRSIVGVPDASAKDAAAVKWRVDAARAKSRLLAVRAGSLQTATETQKELIEAAKRELGLVERKISIARSQTRFNDEDIAKVEELASKRKKTLHGEIDAFSKKLKSAITARSQAQTALDSFAAADPPAAADVLALAKLRLEVAEGRVDAMQFVIEGLESIIQLENMIVDAYRTRRTILEATRPQDRTAALQSLGETITRLKTWENVLRNEIASTSAILSQQESRSAALNSDDPQFALLNEQRATTHERLNLLQRMQEGVIAQRKLFRRWEVEYAPGEEQRGFLSRVNALLAATSGAVSKIWSLELMSFEKKVEMDGKTITGQVPVTLGQVLRALLFFLIGYWVIARFTNRVEKALVGRNHIAEAQARTLRNWAMMFVGVFLAIGTLSFLKIPLTVFAFFGGALAIGLGFGTQTLIKNFISGIIVLVERKVRVGDILDVDGIVGTVTEVNTRSSVIRGPDDVETMIPNSLFLENRVTNWTLSSPKVRRSIRVSVAYGTLPQTVIGVLTDSAARHGLICRDPAPFAVLEDFGDNALVFSLFFWVEFGKGHNAVVVASDLRIMIEKHLRELGISVPFPQRDMHLTTTEPIQVRIENPQP